MIIDKFCFSLKLILEDMIAIYEIKIRFFNYEIFYNKFFEYL